MSPFISHLSLEVRGLQIPRHGGQLDNQAIQILAHLDLATQSARLGQSKGQIQHVIFVVVGLLHLTVVVLACNNDVTRTACTRTSARALHLDVVGLGNVKEVVAVGYGEGIGVAVFVDECDFALFTRLWCVEVAMLRYWCGGKVSRNS